ncbi:tyrosine phosphatase family-domain-containing protein [Cercophora scortea]|uniref:Tyrosine phosphatase family-domain-containing protein n=1 Tax=Cercophora scortea TaxID=314031 RepID=A0AAE0J5Z7_9PEZI|nr:tyrosine phosphatase family-domain-containing protein [Cercophora scortea]
MSAASNDSSASSASRSADCVAPSPPFVHAAGLANLRDIGGYPIDAQPGKAVRRGVIFRAAEPSRLEPDGVAVLQRLGITHVYDLRSEQEFARSSSASQQSPDEAWEGATRIFAPVFRDQDYSPEALAVRFNHYSTGTEGFVKAYATILDAAGGPDNKHAPFKRIVEHLASPTAPPSPLLVHCTAGKDRTGVLCALILALCGVDDDAIAHDYSLTEIGLAPRKPEIIAHLMQTPALFGDRAKAERMVGSRKEDMIATLAMLRETYGSVEEYLVGHCLVAPDSLTQLRRNLIVDVDGEQHVFAGAPTRESKLA